MDIIEIVGQVDGILELRPVLLDLSNIYSDLKTIPASFEKMVEYFENLIKKPKDIIKLKKINLDRISFFDEFDISAMFRNIFSEANT